MASAEIGLIVKRVTLYSAVKMGVMTSQITRVSIVCSTECSGADQRKHESSTSLAFVRGIRRWPMNSPHKGPVKWKMIYLKFWIVFAHPMSFFKISCEISWSLMALRDYNKYNKCNRHILWRSRRPFAETKMSPIFITSYIGSCHFGNLPCNQWWTLDNSFIVCVISQMIELPTD